MFFCGNCTEAQRNYILLDSNQRRNDKNNERKSTNNKKLNQEEKINNKIRNLINENNEEGLQIIDYPSINNDNLIETKNEKNNNINEDITVNVLETIQNIQIGKLENNDQVNLTLSDDSFSGEYL